MLMVDREEEEEEVFVVAVMMRGTTDPIHIAQQMVSE